MSKSWTILAAALVVALSLGLAACGDDDVGDAAEAVATEVEEAGRAVADEASGAIDEARSELEDADVDEDVTDALDEAQAELDDAGDAVDDEALERARDRLRDARTGLEDDLDSADDETRENAEKAAAAIDRAIERIDEELGS
jgi:hypothetical protein